MSAGKKSPAELRERAVRLALEAKEQEPELSWHAIHSRIGSRVGVSKDTLRTWVRKAQVDRGELPGVTSQDASRIKEGT